MRVVIQRIAQASVVIGGDVHSSIGKGLLVLLGIHAGDKEEDIPWLVKKVSSLRVFDDRNGVMNLGIMETGGEILVVSQFTLYASTRKGNRPSYIHAAGETVAIPLYESFVKQLSEAIGKPVATGVFGADMKVELVNDGPVTIIIDSSIRE